MFAEWKSYNDEWVFWEVLQKDDIDGLFLENDRKWHIENDHDKKMADFSSNGSFSLLRNKPSNAIIR